MPAPSPYDHPDAYDIINTPGTASEVDGLESIAARFVLGQPRSRATAALRALNWLEPCSGTGRFLRLIASRIEASRRPGARPGMIVGIDLDPGMNRYAQGRLLALGLERSAAAIRGDIRAVSPAMLRRAPGWGRRRVDVAFCPHNSVRHLARPADLVRHFKAVRSVLSPRGIYIVGLELTPVEQMMTSESVFRSRRGSLHAREVFSYIPPDDASRPFETVISHMELERVRKGREPEMLVCNTSRYALRCWTLEEWESLVRRAGLRTVGVVDTWGGAMPFDWRRYALRVLAQA